MNGSDRYLRTISLLAIFVLFIASPSFARIRIDKAPVVSINSPTAGSTVSGQVTFSITASDDIGIRNVKYDIIHDGTTDYAVKNDYNSMDPDGTYANTYNGSYTFDSATYLGTATSKSITLQARVYDTTVRYTTAKITITITKASSPPPSDTTPPTVSITSPTSGTTQVSGVVHVVASAQDNVGGLGMKQVDFYVDDQYKATDTGTTYSFDWDTTTFADGTHVLKATASDKASPSNQATATFSVMVKNTTVPPPDTTPPTVSISSPTGLVDLVGTISFSANAQDLESGLAKLELFIDGVSQGYSATSPYSVNVDTKGLTNAVHLFLVQATDKAGNPQSVFVSATVKNPLPDTTPPSVSVTAPGASTVSGAVSLAANASDNVGVTQVDFYIDGGLLGSDLSSPYTYSWDSTSVVNGGHTISAKAKDAAGNVGTSASVSVTVNNVVTPPPTGPTRLQLLDGGNMQSSELDFIATKFDTFVMSATQMGWSKIKGLRDRITVMSPRKYMHCYIKAAGIHDEDKHYPATTSNMYWYGPSGQKLINTWNGWYYIDIITPSIHNAWVTILGNYIQDPTVVTDNSGNTYSIRQMFDGVFWDNSSCMMNNYMEDPVTLNLVTPSNYTDPNYYAAVDDILRSMKNGTSTFNPAGWPTDMVANSYRGDAPSADLRGVTLTQDQSGRKGVDGLMFEDFMLRGYPNNLRTYNSRDRIHQNLRDFEKVSYDNGKKAYADEYFYIPEKCSGTCYQDSKYTLTIDQAKQLRHFAFAAYLLVYNSNTYFQMIPQNSDNNNYTQYFPEYTLDLGQPVAFNCSGADGTSGSITRFCDSVPDKLYIRTFQNGMVVVNPDSIDDTSAPASRNFTLPAITDCPSGHACHWEQLEFIGGGAVIHSGSVITPQGNIQATDLTGITTKSMPKTSGLILRKVVQ